MSSVLFLVSGSIAAYKACAVISGLVKAGREVQVIASRSAFEFIGRSTLEGLSGRAVLSELFEPGHAMDHINLVRSSSEIVLCPASGNTINKLAAGLGDDLIGTIAMAWDQKIPFHIFPAMNQAMYAHPSVQESLTKLANWGYTVHETASGDLACGEFGLGRLLEPEEILRRLAKSSLLKTFPINPPIDRELKLQNISMNQPSIAQKNNSNLQKRAVPKNILITSGGTTEPIDAVRFISNTSTGKTGATIADSFAAQGHFVTLLRAETSIQPKTQMAKELTFNHFDDFASKLKTELQNYSFDMVVHAAAVSDFKVVNHECSKKLDSEGTLTLQLQRNPKLIDSIRSWSQSKVITLVGFKLTAGLSTDDQHKAGLKLCRSSQADFVVCNDLEKITNASHLFDIYHYGKPKIDVAISPANQVGDVLIPVASVRSAVELSRRLTDLVEEANVGAKILTPKDSTDFSETNPTPFFDAEPKRPEPEVSI
jgi:phosphopantothenoylcysteine decarboxylase / phosphopantothenate---cysteine ligase